MERIWNKIDGSQIEDLAKYINDHINKFSGEYELYVGTDSQRVRKRFTVLFSSVICIYRKGKGAHIIYSKHKVDNIKDKFTRLRMEINYSIQIADYLNLHGVLTKPEILTIHVDLSPEVKNDSNRIYKEAIGWVKGCGYECVGKPNAPSASYAADWVVKNKDIPFYEFK